MTAYAFALFLHIVGALGLFVSLGLEWTSQAYLQRASSAEQAREWLSLRGWVMRLGPASLALLLVSGFYLMAANWGWVGWIVAALAGLVLIAVIGAALTGSRISSIGQAAAREHGTLSPALRQKLSDPWLWVSIQTRTVIALGIAFMMVVKPSGLGSLLTLGGAVILGLALSLFTTRRNGRQREAAPSRS